MRILFLGRTRWLYDAVVELHRRGHQISGIITSKASPEYDINERDFAELANRLSVPFLLTKSVSEDVDSVFCKDVDLAVSVNWITVITDDFIRRFRIGVMNLHAGDLPAYRGNACPNWAILNGDDHVTLTAHLMEGGKLDCGRVIAQRRYDLSATTEIGDVYAWINKVSSGLISEAVDKLGKSSKYVLKYVSQSEEGAFRCWPRRPEDGFIEWNRPSEHIDRLIRASGMPFAGAYCYVVEKGVFRKLIVLRARQGPPLPNDRGVPGQVLHNDSETGVSLVLCAAGTTLELLKCRYSDEAEPFAPGGRWRSIRMRLGVRTEDMLWEIVRRGDDGVK